MEILIQIFFLHATKIMNSGLVSVKNQVLPGNNLIFRTYYSNWIINVQDEKQLDEKLSVAIAFQMCEETNEFAKRKFLQWQPFQQSTIFVYKEKLLKMKDLQ